MLRKRLYGCLAAVTIAAASMTALVADDGLNIRLRDDCDPASFNAAIGDGTCVGGGDTTFDDFSAEHAATGQVDKWRFNNDRAESDRNKPILVTNRGGETHTFTKVAQFGGGFVPPLNALPDGTTLPLAPECAAAIGIPQPPSANNLFVGAGGVASAPGLKRGERAKFQCCIHPWMHSEITGK
jgi:hypothetical protein